MRSGCPCQLVENGDEVLHQGRVPARRGISKAGRAHDKNHGQRPPACASHAVLYSSLRDLRAVL